MQRQAIYMSKELGKRGKMTMVQGSFEKANGSDMGLHGQQQRKGSLGKTENRKP